MVFTGSQQGQSGIPQKLNFPQFLHSMHLNWVSVCVDKYITKVLRWKFNLANDTEYGNRENERIKQ